MPQAKSILSNASKYEMEDMSLLVDAFMDDDLSDSEPVAPTMGAGVGSGAAAAGIGGMDAFVGLNDSAALSGGVSMDSKGKAKNSTVVSVSVSNSNTIHWGPTIRSVYN